MPRKTINIADWRARAKARLPAPIYHYLEGGADDEVSLVRNVSAFGNYYLLPRPLVNVERVSLRRRVLGLDLKLPLILSPTGMSRLFNHHGELAVSRAAAEAGIFYALSTMATTTLEDVAAAGNGPKIFQLYIFKDRGLTRELVERCRAAGYHALCLTVDTPIAGNRERDKRTGMTIPPRFGLSSLMSFAVRPGWSLQILRNRQFSIANVAHRVDALRGNSMSVIEYVNSQFDRTLTWDDAEWLAQLWRGPFVIKGVLRVDDVRMAVKVGASAVMLSNHGGRQLDGAPAPIDCVAPVRDAVGNTIDLIVDGGVRRGSDVLKALALGASACSIGRPYLYGLAADGQEGVASVIRILSDEMALNLALCGCRSLDELSESVISSRSLQNL